MKHSILLALALGLPYSQSSRAVLGPYLSQAEVRLPPGDTGLELTRLFAGRGYALVDQSSTQAGLSMQFKGSRAIAHNGIELGSVFVVSITRAPENRSVVSIDGSPTVNGGALCTPGTWKPCTLTNNPGYTDGQAEAEVVHGVFSELALERLIVPFAPDSPALLQANYRAVRRAVPERGPITAAARAWGAWRSRAWRARRLRVIGWYR